jgi:hypothetical protein
MKRSLVNDSNKTDGSLNDHGSGSVVKKKPALPLTSEGDEMDDDQLESNPKAVRSPILSIHDCDKLIHCRQALSNKRNAPVESDEETVGAKPKRRASTNKPVIIDSDDSDQGIYISSSFHDLVVTNAEMPRFRCQAGQI